MAFSAPNPDPADLSTSGRPARRLRWPNARGTEASSAGPHSSLTGGAYSTVDDLEPALVALLEECKQRILGGEVINIEKLAAEHPAWAVKLRWLIPPIQNMAELGQDLEGQALAPAWDDSEAAAQRAFRNFRIIREVGRGGMGIVYEAQQAALGRHVALKVLPLATALDPRALQRFQLEAQVAGWLQHPRIVPVYAVGLVGDVPYFAMRFIEGGSLAELIGVLRRRSEPSDPPADFTEPVANGKAAGPPDSHAVDLAALADQLLSGRFAPARRDSDSGRASYPRFADMSRDGASPASIRARGYLNTVVRLGIQAAEALDYAHGQGVVHRDIKPANLLLDRQGDLWVADFGMADVQGDAGVTMTGDLPGTLRYMSPEQAAGKRALIDRRTDIYSLGATLYEMLTLQPAIKGSERVEIIRRIAEDEPEPIRRLNPAVPVDLATIVTKALSKEPSRRYETARQLADDLERFLDGRPIAARPVGPLARAWRWCRRKPVQAGLAAALVMAVVVGFAGFTWEWRDAVRQKGLKEEQRALAESAKKEALAQAAKADAVNTFLIDKLLGQASPNNNPLANRVTLRQALDKAAGEVGASFRGQPAIEAAIRLALGQTYHDQGDYAKAETHYRAALEIYSKQPDENGTGRAKAMTKLGHNLGHLLRFAEAEPLLLRAVEESTRLLGPTDPLTLDCREYLATLRSDEGRLSEAEALYRPLLDDTLRAQGLRTRDTLVAMNNLAMVFQRQNRFEEAERLFRETLALGREVHGPESPFYLKTMGLLAATVEKLGKPDEAESLFRQCLDVQRRVLGPDHPNTLGTTTSIAALLRSQGRLDEAEGLLRASLESQRRTLGPDHIDTRATEKQLSSLVAARGGKK